MTIEHEFPGIAAQSPSPGSTVLGLPESDARSSNSDVWVPHEQDLRDFLSWFRRMLRALVRRAVDGDLEALRVLVELRGDVDSKITDAVTGLRHDPVYPESWENIATALGVTRRQAYRRYGHVGGRRRPGGQPSRLR